MVLIKKYANRKLYDTERNRYITLDEITKMVKDGQEIQVVDLDKGKDITAQTLAQIIMEREKNERDVVPRAILAELIRTGEESWNALRSKLASPADLILQVDREIAIRLENLIQRGEIAEETGRMLRDQLIDSGKFWISLGLVTEKEIEEALVRQGFPTRNEFQTLEEQIDALEKKIDEIVASTTSAGQGDFNKTSAE
jgi:polyhydroxyalkanoate synthesis repressor PhaR